MGNVEMIVGMLFGGLMLAAIALFSVKAFHYISKRIMFAGRRMISRLQR